jgi:hypothetical protein
VKVQSIPKKHHDKYSIAIEVVEDHIAQAFIVPVAMYKEQFLKKPKLTHRIVRGHDSLPPFLPTDTHSDIC